MMTSNATDIGGFKEVSFMIKGKGVYSRLKYESGVHRVQRVPETEASGRIHTSTSTVAVLPEAEDVEVEVNANDLKNVSIYGNISIYVNDLKNGTYIYKITKDNVIIKTDKLIISK